MTNWRTRAAGVGVVFALVVAVVAVVVSLSEEPTSSPAGGASTTEAHDLWPSAQNMPVAAFIGDSFTLGAKAGSLDARYTSVFCKLKRWKCIVNGEGSTGFVNPGGHKNGKSIYADRIPRVANRSTPPDIVIVQGGVNDPGSATVQPAVQRMVTKLKHAIPGVKVVVVGPVQPPRRSPVVVNRNRVAMKAGAVAGGAQFVDPIAEGWFTGGEMFSDDGIHPNAQGYRVFGERLAAAVSL